MSSSAPARYFHHTPSTPIHFSLQLNTTPASSRAGNVQKLPKPGSRRDSLKLPVLSRVQYDSPYGVFGSGGQTGAPAAMVVVGVSHRLLVDYEHRYLLNIKLKWYVIVCFTV